jgi:hypothetical protein
MCRLDRPRKTVFACAAAVAALVAWSSSAAIGQDAPQRWRTPATAEDLAVLIIEQHDPAELTVSDWEFVLSFRDASPANKAAADRVWKTIQEKQKNGAVRLKIPVTVISATANTIEAAVTENNASAQTPDLHVELAVPLKNPPPRGAKIAVVGVITGYTPEPFRFTMQNADAPDLPGY